MSQVFKIILGVAVLLIVAGGVYFWFFHEAKEFPVSPTAESSDTLPTGTNTSNDALDKDLEAISEQIKAFDTDTESINESISDEPVEQIAL